MKYTVDEERKTITIHNFGSNLKVYDHILNYKNSILIRNNSIKDWEKKIKYYFKNITKLKYLSKNASKNVKNYTWEKRINKLDKFLNV